MSEHPSGPFAQLEIEDKDGNRTKMVWDGGDTLELFRIPANGAGPFSLLLPAREMDSIAQNWQLWRKQLRG
jgi:hypothetical protein